MHTSPSRSDLLAAGDVDGLLALNRARFGSAQMARGYSAAADAMATTADGRDLSELFDEFQAAAALSNSSQESFVSLLSYATASPTVSVLQSLGADHSFQQASEFGIPTSRRISPSTLNMGASFRWYDNRWGSTWQYLAEADSAEIEANVAAIVQADADLVFGQIMGTVFGNENRQVTDARTSSAHTVYAFANGDGWVPPNYSGNTFDATHTHYRVTGAATVDSADLDEAIADYRSHGYSQENGSQIVFFVNSVEGDVINGFRVSAGAKEDFVPAAGARFFSQEQLVGTQPSATFAGFPVKGSYGEALVVESSRIPAGYVASVASGGANLPSNPIMLRSHPRFEGLQLIQGSNSSYPLTDSYWVRGLGTGVRHRLAGMVQQVKATGAYAPPSLYSV